MREPKTLHHGSDHRAHRAEHYPITGDALDAIAEGLRAYQRGEPLPPKTIAWLDARDAVKARFRKPAAA
ncbi:hypothetical protein [Methylobacterium sp. J-092]|uniref:hypothetical protein n=1 Tax=Methylobacterium sp. J-092 TaxID=2836667 RepID=UPI001FBA0979|nr:hypothetical protein [Methylobacterium sp. J-092]MCJ2009814.1 hypothetical protein [Methylobacterium sp. J-092]